MIEVERVIGERNTRAFIRANPISISLNRPQKVRTPAGGWQTVDPEVIPEQTFRIVPMSGLVWDRTVTTPDEGRVSDVTLQLIGMPDADVKKNDWFEFRGGFAQVIHVSPVQGYRKEARLNWYQDKATLAS